MSAETQTLIINLRRLENEKTSLINKIVELESEAKEHKLVLDVFEKVNSDRRCYRMVGGVLVPRTVAEVKPALQLNSDKVTEILEKLKQDLERASKQYSEIASKLEPFLAAEQQQSKQEEEKKSGPSSVLV